MEEVICSCCRRCYEGKAVIIELKIADTYAELEEKGCCGAGTNRRKRYDAELKLEGYHEFIKYGISFIRNYAE